MIKRTLSLILACLCVMSAALTISATDATDTAQAPALSVAPGGLCTVDGTTYLTDRYTRSIYTLEDGQLTHLTGVTTPTDPSGRPLAGFRDAGLGKSSFGDPRGIVPFRDGLLVADSENHALRYVDLSRRRVYTYAGRGKAGFRDGTGAYANLDSPTGLAVADNGRIYIADSGNHAIRVMTKAGKVTTLLGGEEGCALGSLAETRLSYPTALCFAGDTLYVVDAGNHRIIAIRDGRSSLVAGATLTGDAAIEGDYLDGPADLARFSTPMSIAVRGDTVYVADSGNAAVRVIRDGFVTSLTAPTWVSPDALLIDGDTLLVGDSFARTVTPLPEETPALTFTDLDEAETETVRFVTANRLMEGTGEGIFDPDATATVGMVLTILARLDGMDTDAGETWYEVGLAWAADQSIATVTDPDATVTADALAAILAAYDGEEAPTPTEDETPITRIALADALMKFLTQS